MTGNTNCDVSFSVGGCRVCVCGVGVWVDGAVLVGILVGCWTRKGESGNDDGLRGG